jgi:hypothetical protein
MTTGLKPSSLLKLGIVLLAVSLAGSFLTQALLGQQQSAAMAVSLWPSSACWLFASSTARSSVRHW